MNFTPSIRQKITLGYYAILAMIIGLSVFTFLELRYLEKKIMFGEAISEFFDTSLEIRRFEKNYFLYGQQSDYDENIQYVSRARDIIDSNLTGFNAVASSEQIADIQDSLTRVQGLDGPVREDRQTRTRSEGTCLPQGSAPPGKTSSP